MMLDRLNAFMFAYPLVRHAVAPKRGPCLRCFTPSALLLMGLPRFVPLQISKIEPFCVAAWATADIVAPGDLRASMLVMPHLVSATGGWLDVRRRQLLPRFLKPPLVAGGIHDISRAAARKHRQA
jgi:hypothetical protein